jgi:hypothetical protein
MSCDEKDFDEFLSKNPECDKLIEFLIKDQAFKQGFLESAVAHYYVSFREDVKE